MRIVIVEDEIILRDLLRLLLENAGFRVDCASNAKEAHALLYEPDVDLVILDLGLPDEDGLVVARQIRARSDVPIVIFTSNEDNTVRLIGYELGIDDFIPKDTGSEELLVRIRNALRRGGRRPLPENGAASDATVTITGWKLDFLGHTAVNEDGREAVLTTMEFRVLAALAKAPNRILSRAQLLDAITAGGDPPSDRTVDAFVSRIRKKLGPEFPLATVKGLGYKLTMTRAAEA